MNPLFVFGTRDISSLANFYFKNDTKLSVTAFTEDENCIDKPSFEGIPIVPFEKVLQDFPNADIFLPIYNNSLRNRKFNEAEAAGLNIISYISSRATCFGQVGKNCFIMEDNTIQPYVEIGNNVILWSGNHVGHHSKINDNVFVSSHVVISGHCDVGSFSWLGVNSCVKDSTKIAEGSFIAMGAVVTKDTEPYGKYKGNPAERTGIVEKGQL
jgi:sugar O-acyltransferase (sialic acid O-acetyltransferase NeuD family)